MTLSDSDQVAAGALRFTVRLAVADDAPALRVLIEQSVRGLQRYDYTAEQIEGALGHALGLDTQLIADGTYFVVESADQVGTIIACGGWSMRATLYGSDHGPGRMMSLLDPKVDAAKIRAIFVHPDYACRGVGSLLLQHCETAARRAGFLRFEMGSTLTGVPLYTLKGYREIGYVIIPLPNGAVLPVVRMEKP